ncbi:hypothetical protein [Metabacillus idriensis]|uniref:hypothetical protein n=1 Tax=Metabacillus idriensis TaxID=324768 RepID=UPI001CD7FEAD|nr:hypothetical protein [Metabacillus idriensis]
MPTKEELAQHLLDKMTNQDIAKIYGTSFQKIIQLIKRYELNPNELRKVNMQIVYLHILNGSVVYVGSGLWYRCRRYTNRRNSLHRKLMQDGMIIYEIVGEFEKPASARRYEHQLIGKYKKLGQAIYNKHE